MTETDDPKRHRGIYLLPNIFTAAALFAGFYAIVASMHGHFEPAAIAVFVAMVLDGLDGRVARLTHTESAFGAEFDSLADMVSFGLAPALVMYQWSLASMVDLGRIPGKLGWLAAFAYAACTALRLARFNTQLGSADKRYFMGLPSPSAAAIVVGLVWVGNDLNLRGEDLVIPAMIITVGASLLMVSRVLYHSFKQWDLKGRVPFETILIVILVLVFIAVDTPKTLFIIFLAYGLSGPVLWLWRARQRARRRAAEAPRTHNDSGPNRE
ncbi:MAG: CDP-diacylglycerol--serine O-phosphatidyltransferase [Gammaproteobacteria bacterium]|nr:CDP-diacylglycerol--serine O-phosphatidyltransferase [Gammaproteobacteria bacterium]MCP5458477.1 CDP-diacylglycerol--serine O-phosphatidyltransferase [Gammaproteobacteria bacterium]